MKFALITYPQVASLHLDSLRGAARTGNIILEEWQPNEVSIWCEGTSPIPLYRNEPVQPDIILHRALAWLIGIIEPALSLWKARGTIVPNAPHQAVLARDKLATTIILAKAGLPYVPTLGFYPTNTVSLDRCGRDRVVVKPAHGLLGRGVLCFPDARSAEKEQQVALWEDAPPLLSEHFVAQPFAGKAGEDIRAFVVGDRCVGLIRRMARSPDWRANLSLGGSATPMDVAHPAANLAIAATAALGLDYAGVDIVEDDAGELFVLEVDAWAGFAGLESVTGADVAGAILAHALQMAQLDK